MSRNSEKLNGFEFSFRHFVERLFGGFRGIHHTFSVCENEIGNHLFISNREIRLIRQSCMCHLQNLGGQVGNN